jgi:hypothetical protein
MEGTLVVHVSIMSAFIMELQNFYMDRVEQSAEAGEARCLPFFHFCRFPSQVCIVSPLLWLALPKPSWHNVFCSSSSSSHDAAENSSHDPAENSSHDLAESSSQDPAASCCAHILFAP